ncbi:hypothetical protein, partial [Gracilibacillus oryzae]|uniref:hypothetical protein n=1 Tax=Gracilibacillus oryzae TaxID=1672701 RepID=UPI001D17F0E7
NAIVCKLFFYVPMNREIRSNIYDENNKQSRATGITSTTAFDSYLTPLITYLTGLTPIDGSLTLLYKNT